MRLAFLAGLAVVLLLIPLNRRAFLLPFLPINSQQPPLVSHARPKREYMRARKLRRQVRMRPSQAVAGSTSEPYN